MRTSVFITVLCLVAAAAQAVVLEESFSGTAFPPEMWTVYNEDGGVRQWSRNVGKYRSVPACVGVVSESRTLRNDDWLVTRRIFPTPGDNQLTFWVRSHNRVKAESLELWVSTGGWQVSEFTHSLGGFTIGSSTYEQQTVSLAQFDSTPIYFAFRSRSLDQRTVYIDDIGGPELIPADVGVSALSAPRAYEPPDTSIVPAVVVKNYGSTRQAGFQVKMVIVNTESGDTVYNQTAVVDSVDPQQVTQVYFATAWQTGPGRYQVVGRTLLAGDAEPRNDSAAGICQVIGGEIHDAATNAIIAPGGMIPPGPVVPRAEVENLGNVTETFPVFFCVRWSGNPVYQDSAEVTLGPGARDTVDFLSWNALSGIYTLEAFTSLAGDRDPANDSQFGTVEVTEFMHDVGVDEILAPLDTVVQGTTVTPTAVVANYGDYAETFRTVFWIGTGYADTVQLSLAPGISDTARFRSWLAAQSGSFPVVAHTTLAGDEDPGNDTLRKTVYVDPLQGQAEENARPMAPSLRLRTVGATSAEIAFQARAGALVELAVYDACGDLVGRHVTVGTGRFERFVWAAPASGVYILKAESAGQTLVRKLVLY